MQAILNFKLKLTIVLHSFFCENHYKNVSFFNPVFRKKKPVFKEKKVRTLLKPILPGKYCEV